MCSVFLLKTQIRLWNVCPDLSVYDTLKSDSFDMKLSCPRAVKKMLGLAEKSKYPKFRRKL